MWLNLNAIKEQEIIVLVPYFVRQYDTARGATSRTKASTAELRLYEVLHRSISPSYLTITNASDNKSIPVFVCTT